MIKGLLLALALFAPTLLAIGASSVTHRTLSIDARRSKIVVSVYKEGIFAFAADNHTVIAPVASGSLDVTRKIVSVTFRVAQMQVQDPPSRRDKVQANMLGPAVLDAQRYPNITFRSDSIDESPAGRWIVRGHLILHGQTRPVEFQVTRKAADRFVGSATLRQTDFGITPIRIAGGTVRVKDAVRVDFDIIVGNVHA